jgi:hypothetical protein
MMVHPFRVSFRKGYYFFLNVDSSETVSFFLPFFLREANTLRPLAEAIFSRKPCLFLRFLLDGWYVRFISENQLFALFPIKGCKNAE